MTPKELLERTPLYSIDASRDMNIGMHLKWMVDFLPEVNTTDLELNELISNAPFKTTMDVYADLSIHNIFVSVVRASYIPIMLIIHSNDYEVSNRYILDKTSFDNFIRVLNTGYRNKLEINHDTNIPELDVLNI